MSITFFTRPVPTRFHIYRVFHITYLTDIKPPILNLIICTTIETQHVTIVSCIFAKVFKQTSWYQTFLKHILNRTCFINTIFLYLIFIIWHLYVVSNCINRKISFWLKRFYFYILITSSIFVLRYILIFYIIGK